MPRLPVVATIREAYHFTFAHLGAIIGLIWVPMVALTVLGFFTFQRYYNDFISHMASGNAAAMGLSMLMMMLYLVAVLVLQAVIYVAVVQLVMGARKDAPMAHFAFGAQEWRLFRAFFAFAGLILLLIMPAVMLLSLAGPALPAAVRGVLLLVMVYGVILVAMPRFLALLPAISVAETVPVLRRSWELSAGHFWRLLGLMIGIFAPFFLLFVGVEMALAGQVPPASGASQEVQIIAGMVRAREILPVMSGLSFLMSPLMIGLFASASVSAWRRIKGEPVTNILA